MQAKTTTAPGPRIQPITIKSVPLAKSTASCRRLVHKLGTTITTNPARPGQPRTGRAAACLARTRHHAVPQVTSWPLAQPTAKEYKPHPAKTKPTETAVVTNHAAAVKAAQNVKSCRPLRIAPEMRSGNCTTKATNTTEPDGNGIGPNQTSFARLGEEERGPSLLDQRHRAVITFTYQLPYNITAGTVTQLASSRPFNAVTGVDNNGDGANNDRPVVDGSVLGKSAFRGTATQDVSMFIEGRIKPAGRTILLRLEGFNLLNHANILGRAQTTYGDLATVNNTFGQVVAPGTAANALPALANIDPPRMFQFQVRFGFYRSIRHNS